MPGWSWAWARSLKAICEGGMVRLYDGRVEIDERDEGWVAFSQYRTSLAFAHQSSVKRVSECYMIARLFNGAFALTTVTGMLGALGKMKATSSNLPRRR